MNTASESTASETSACETTTSEITASQSTGASGASSLCDRGSKPTLVGLVMGSISDWGVMEHTSKRLSELGIGHEVRILSAHRMPVEMAEYAQTAVARGLKCVIAGAGGAAHLPGMLAAHTNVPVLGVPLPATALVGVDALLSIVQMPAGVPVATFAIGKPGAINAAIFAAQIIGVFDQTVRDRLDGDRRTANQAAKQSQQQLPER